ncbi:MAG: fibronectin type III domain-containing protein [Patescibacteria group bacterium]
MKDKDQLRGKVSSKLTGFALFQRLKILLWVGFVIIAISVPVLFDIFTANAYTWSSADVVIENEGYFADLKYDGSGNPGIVYTRDAGADYNVYYAYYNGSWNVELVDSNSDFYYVSLVFDSNSIPKIAYFDGDNGNVIYARRGASGTTTLNPTNGTGELDGTDTDWNYTVIETTGSIGDKASIAIDENDNIGIAYQDATNGNLEFARYVGTGGSGCDTLLSTWSCETVYSTDTVGGGVSLAYSGSTAVIASQYVNPSAYLMVAIRDGAGAGTCDVGGANNTNWNCALIDDADTMAAKRNISVATGVNGVIGIAYTTLAYDLKYAYNTVSDPATCSQTSSWTCETVAANTASDKFKNWVSLILANGVVPNVAYFDSFNGDMFFAEKVSGSWNIETPFTTNSIGWYASLARTGTTNGIAMFDDTQDDLMYGTATIEYNIAPVVSLGSTSQSGDALGKITISATVEDSDYNDTKLKVEYSDDGGSTWYDPYLDSATPNSGSVDLNNANVYQIGETNKVDTSGGAKTVTIVWDTQSVANGNGSLDGTDQVDIKLRFTANDGTIDSTATATANFEIDNLDPSGGLSVLSPDTTTTSSINLDWTAISTEANWSSLPIQAHYEVWYGTNQTDVQNRTSNENTFEWDNDNDVNLATKATATTTITGLSVNTLYYFKIWAVDSYGNEMTVDDVNSYSYANIPSAPTLSLPDDGDSTKLKVIIVANSNPDTTEYSIQVGYGVTTKYAQADGSLGDLEVWRSYTDWGGALGQIISGLTGNTQYNIKTKARNGNNVETALSAETSKYSYATNASELVLTNASTLADYILSLTFTNNSASGFKIDRDTDCDDVYETNVYDETNAIPSSPRTFASLGANTCYKYRIEVYNSEGALNSISFAESNELTTPPAQPTGLTVSASTIDSITLDWLAVDSATDYNIYYSDNTLIATINAATDEYTVSGLNSNASYTFYVRASNANGEGIKSSNVSGYTKADLPTNLGITNIDADAVRWTWQSGGAEAGFFTRTENPVDAIADWTTNLYWDQSSLTENNLIIFYVKAKNESAQETSEATISRYSGMQVPSGLNFSSVGINSITLQAIGTFTNLSEGSSGLYFSHDTANSGWTKVNNWVSSSLTANTLYTFDSTVRNGDGVLPSSGEGGGLGDTSLYTLHPDPTDIELTALATDSITIELSDTVYNIDQGQSGIYFSNNTASTNSDWLTVNSWTSPELLTNTEYEFSVKIRNGDAVETSTITETFFSAQAVPTDLVVSDLATTSFAVQAAGLSNVQEEGVYFSNSTLGVNSGWTGNAFSVVGLSANTGYNITTKARNGDNVETAVYSEEIYSAQTIPVLTENSKETTTITLNIDNVSNRVLGNSGIYIENTTRGTNSGWITTSTWQETGLSRRTAYTYRAKARNGNGVDTEWSNNLSITTSGGSIYIPPEPPPVDPVYQCNDGVDNDLDGKIDMNDLGCSVFTDNNEGDEPIIRQCNDGIDNDFDGKIDYPADEGCLSAEDDLELLIIPVVIQCSDGIDNDNDGLIDMMDSGCESLIDLSEEDEIVTLPQCSDNIDNDNDGKIDYPEDLDCLSLADNSENFFLYILECMDNNDNDNDGKIDLLDPGCSSNLDTNEIDLLVPPACSDELDNDNDGKIDLEDEGCSSVGDLDETNPQCMDGLDNDSDGNVDMNDFGCESLSDNDESNEPVVYQCNDNVDNDKDGQIDLADRGCVNSFDQTEFGEVIARPVITTPALASITVTQDSLFISGTTDYPNMQVDIYLNNTLLQTVFSQSNKVFSTTVSGFRKGGNYLFVRTVAIDSVLKRVIYSDGTILPSPGIDQFEITYVYDESAPYKYVTNISLNGQAEQADYVDLIFDMPDNYGMNGSITVANKSWQTAYTRTGIIPSSQNILKYASRDKNGNRSRQQSVSFDIKYPEKSIIPDEGIEDDPDDDDNKEAEDGNNESESMVGRSIDSIVELLAKIFPEKNEKIKEIINNNTQKIKESVKFIRALTIDNPTVKRINRKIQLPAVAATAVTTLIAVATVGSTGAAGASILTYLQFLFTQPLMFFARKNKRGWGLVYDSVTKKPLGLAVVRIYNAGTKQLVKTAVTDKDGRYSFIVNPGKYFLSVDKNEMKFPDKLLRKAVTDGTYANLYYGEEFEITGKEAVTKAIPLEPDKKMVDIKTLVKKKIFLRSQIVLTLLGPILAVVSFVINPVAWVGYVAVGQLVAYLIFRRLTLREKNTEWGFVKDSDSKKFVDHAVVRVFDTKYNKLLDNNVTDKNGRFAFLVGGGGEYYLTADKPGYFEARTERFDLRKKEQGYLKSKIFMQPIGGAPTKLAEGLSGPREIVRSHLGRSKEKEMNGIKKIVYKEEEKFSLPLVETLVDDLHEDYYAVDVLKKD